MAPPEALVGPASALLRGELSLQASTPGSVNAATWPQKNEWRVR
jgi:hypothetical protein